jgi:Asp-tRNA(Asn)/Glu-tRNA(Gln) amidotransferase A subunit family amidase
MFQLSSEDAVQAHIARVKEVNPYLNAVVEDRFQDAVRDAQEVDRLVMSHCKTEQEIEKETPVLGVPLTVKESCSVKGCITVKLSYFLDLHLQDNKQRLKCHGRAITKLKIYQFSSNIK